MVTNKPLERALTPLKRVHYVLVGDIVPGSHASVEDISAGRAIKGHRYDRKTNLVTKSIVITKEIKDRLIEKMGKDEPLLVGDIDDKDTESQEYKISGLLLNDILDHMEAREKILTKPKYNLKRGSDGMYPRLLDSTTLINQHSQTGRLKPKDYSVPLEAKIILAVDVSDPNALGPQLAYARAVEAELRFQQRFFSRNDSLEIVVYGQRAEEYVHLEDYVREHRIRFSSKDAKHIEPRNTHLGLEKCVQLAEKNGDANKLTHIYHLTSGPAADGKKTGSVAEQIKRKRIGFTQFVVGEEYADRTKHLCGQAQLLQTTEDGGGDIYFVKGSNPELLSLMVNEHFEKYRIGRAS